jgi:hypothetical protein
VAKFGLVSGNQKQLTLSCDAIHLLIDTTQQLAFAEEGVPGSQRWLLARKDDSQTMRVAAPRRPPIEILFESRPS